MKSLLVERLISPTYRSLPGDAPFLQELESAREEQPLSPITPKVVDDQFNISEKVSSTSAKSLWGP